jgi:class 3 adenylate cyclase/tetratricopeptide (TPR) repeat protein
LEWTEFKALRCKGCEFENREGRKYCASCGAALPLACRECGEVNDAGDRFCGGCGRPLAEEAVAPPEPARRAAPEGDRRPVTVLFCDLVGYTRLSSQLDPEVVHALLERFFTLVDTIVERFGGTIDKHIGDAAMALFGAPVAHGNDAERAVRAALEIQAALPNLNSGLSSPLAAHIGVATGEVVASSVGSQRHRDYTVTGEAANVAARLQALAESGETLVSDAVYQATHHAMAYEPVGPLRLKGLDRPGEVWRLKGTSVAIAEAPALVGRRSEMAQLRAVLDACIEGRSGAVILLRGEAGIGKTRLMDELQSAAAALGMATHAGLVLDFGTERGHGAVRTVVAGLVGLAPEAPSEAVESAIAAALRDLPMKADDALYLRDLLEVSQPEASRAVYQAMDATARTQRKERAVEDLIKARANGQPILIRVEDIHWADAETFSLLAAISRATSESRSVLAMTTRVEGDPLDAHWRAMAGGASLITVDLSPLSPADALSIAHRFIDADAFAAQCVERAGGNPLFLEQLLRSAGDLTDGRLPSSIQNVVLARTDLLAAPDRRAIQAASVLGQRFSLPHLRALLEEPGYSGDALLRNVLLRPAEGGLQFAHALVRDGVYGSLTHARRRDLHKAAAAIFVDDPVLRAEHLDRAGETEAPRAYLEASKAQAGLFRRDQAVALATRGLALAANDRDIAALALHLGDLQQDAGRGVEALDAYRRAFAASAADTDRWRALLGKAAANRLLARIDDAFSALAEAEAMAGPDRDDCALAELHYLRGNLHFARGEMPACRGEHEIALEAARRIASPEWQARALSGLADAQYMDCRMATALRNFGDCVELCEAHGFVRIAAPNRVMMGHCRIYGCDFDEGLGDMRKALEIAVRIGNRHAEMFATQSMGLLLTAAGRYSEAEEFQGSALQQAHALKARRYEAIILGQSAEVALSNGRRGEALALARAGRKISDETGPGFVGPILQGLIALTGETSEERETALAAGERLLAKGAVGHNHFWFRRYTIERALLAEDWNEAENQAEALRLRTSEEPLAYASCLAVRGRVLARRGRGDATEADEKHLAQALALAAKADMRVDALGVALRRT